MVCPYYFAPYTYKIAYFTREPKTRKYNVRCRDSLPDPASNSQTFKPFAERLEELGNNSLAVFAMSAFSDVLNTDKGVLEMVSPEYRWYGQYVYIPAEDAGNSGNSILPEFAVVYRLARVTASHRAVMGFQGDFGINPPLPYKFVIFKNSVPENNWADADIFPFDQQSPLPVITNAADGSCATVAVLAEFCVAALEAIFVYLRRLNNDAELTPRGYTWNIRSVHIERGHDLVISSKEFGIMVELVDTINQPFFIKDSSGGGGGNSSSIERRITSKVEVHANETRVAHYNDVD
ncbi:hypothetical protein ABW20_dc0106585 [Dactylellina cionopaga]|nr:hypothetical protein ABW20_dc0106585 [Dactylellina cionopaga]